jgi:hypothetical protein
VGVWAQNLKDQGWREQGERYVYLKQVAPRPVCRLMLDDVDEIAFDADSRSNT